MAACSRTTNDERRTTNDERRTTNDERRTTTKEVASACLGRSAAVVECVCGAVSKLVEVAIT